MSVGTPTTIIFGPNAQVITAISNANPGVVTTQSNHGYINGLYVRISMPGTLTFGMSNLKNQVYLINVLSPTTFSISVDTTLFGTFTTNPNQSCQSIPVSETASTLLNAEMNILTPIGG